MDKLQAILLGILIGMLLIIGITTLTEHLSSKSQIELQEQENEICCLNEITLGQVYKVNGAKFVLTDINRWQHTIELIFSAIKFENDNK